MFPAIEKLGGWSAFGLVLKDNGIPLTKQRKWNWKARGRLPADAIRVLSAELSQRGIAFTADDFHPTDEEAA